MRQNRKGVNKIYIFLVQIFAHKTPVANQEITKQERRARSTSSSQINHARCRLPMGHIQKPEVILSCTISPYHANNCMIFRSGRHNQIKLPLSPKSRFHHMRHPFRIKVFGKLHSYPCGFLKFHSSHITPVFFKA